MNRGNINITQMRQKAISKPQTCTGVQRYSGSPRLHNVHCNDMHINECKDSFQCTTFFVVMMMDMGAYPDEPPVAKHPNAL